MHWFSGAEATILIPDEIPTLTAIIYSLLPPVKLGKTSLCLSLSCCSCWALSNDNSTALLFFFTVLLKWWGLGMKFWSHLVVYKIKTLVIPIFLNYVWTSMLLSHELVQLPFVEFSKVPTIFFPSLSSSIQFF